MISEINLTPLGGFRPAPLRMSAKEIMDLKPVAGALARLLEERAKAIGEWLRPLLEARIDGADKLPDDELVTLAMASWVQCRVRRPTQCRGGLRIPRAHPRHGADRRAATADGMNQRSEKEIERIDQLFVEAGLGAPEHLPLREARRLCEPAARPIANYEVSEVCQKRIYPSLAAAGRVIRSRQRQGAGNLRPYKCDLCQGFHISSYFAKL